MAVSICIQSAAYTFSNTRNYFYFIPSPFIQVKVHQPIHTNLFSDRIRICLGMYSAVNKNNYAISTEHYNRRIKTISN